MCQPQKEEMAHRHLKRERKLESFWPHISAWVGAAKTTLMRRPYLPSYLFVRTGRERLWEVNAAREYGVSTVVYAAGSEPFPVPDEWVEELQERCDPLGELYVVMPPAARTIGQPGDMIRFGENSPLFGLYAELIKVLDNGVVHAMFQGKLFGATGRVIDLVPGKDDVIVPKSAGKEPGHHVVGQDGLAPPETPSSEGLSHAWRVS